jgi:hypothetical protein
MLFQMHPAVLVEDMDADDEAMCQALRRLGVEPPERPLPAQPPLPGLVAEAAEAEAPAHA